MMSDEEAEHVRLSSIQEVRSYPSCRLPQHLDGQLQIDMV